MAQLHTPVDSDMQPKPRMPHVRPHEFLIRQPFSGWQPMRVTPWLMSFSSVSQVPSLQNCMPLPATATDRALNLSCLMTSSQSPYLMRLLAWMNTLFFRYSLLLIIDRLHSVIMFSNLALSSQKYIDDWPTPNFWAQSQVPVKQPCAQAVSLLAFVFSPHDSTSWMDRKMADWLYIFRVTRMDSRGEITQEAPQAPWEMTKLALQLQSMMMRGGVLRTTVPFSFLSLASSMSPSLQTSSGTCSLLYFLQNSASSTSVNRLRPMLYCLFTLMLLALIRSMFSLYTLARKRFSSSGMRSSTGLKLRMQSSQVRVMGATDASTLLPLEKANDSFTFSLILKLGSKLIFLGSTSTSGLGVGAGAGLGGISLFLAMKLLARLSSRMAVALFWSKGGGFICSTLLFGSQNPPSNMGDPTLAGSWEAGLAWASEGGDRWQACRWGLGGWARTGWSRRGRTAIMAPNRQVLVSCMGTIFIIIAQYSAYLYISIYDFPSQLRESVGWSILPAVNWQMAKILPASHISPVGYKNYQQDCKIQQTNRGLRFHPTACSHFDPACQVLEGKERLAKSSSISGQPPHGHG